MVLPTSHPPLLAGPEKAANPMLKHLSGSGMDVVIHVFKGKFFPRLKALRCIIASSWGPFKESVALLHKDFLVAALFYASPRLFSFFSVTNIIKLERLHRAAIRAITRCLSSSPILIFLLKMFLSFLRAMSTHFSL